MNCSVNENPLITSKPKLGYLSNENLEPLKGFLSQKVVDLLGTYDPEKTAVVLLISADGSVQTLFIQDEEDDLT